MTDEATTDKAPTVEVAKTPSLQYVKTHVIKSEEISSNAGEVEDEFTSFYIGAKGGMGAMLTPPYDFAALEKRETNSNALGPCIDAMETNIDGTGASIEPLSGDTPNSEEEKLIEQVEDFFKQPWPGVSFTTMRRKVRRDLERVGNGNLEALRNGKGDLVFLRYVPARTIRMMQLDAPIMTPIEVMRGGKLVTLNVPMRHRRFAQVINNKLMYFKEFGAPRDLDKSTGEWAKKGEQISLQKRATELIHFTVKTDDKTPYGVPRWINQTPSVVGSRKAEEHNLQFFDRGGIPPILVLVQGGTVAPESVAALSSVMNTSSNTLNAAVVEVYGDGTMEKVNPVKVTVERFGAERQNDSMFESYDEKSEARIRSSFRLPPLFVGKAGDYSFATAYTSYTVAEAQVFQPERMEFDEIINNTVMPAIGAVGLIYRSLPMTVQDVEKQLKALEMAADKGVIDGEQLVDSINEITNLGLKYTEDSDLKPAVPDIQNAPPVTGGDPKDPTSTPSDPPAAKSEDVVNIPVLAGEVAEEIRKGVDKRDKPHWADLMTDVLKLDKEGTGSFKELLAVELYGDISLDPEGAKSLAGCTMAVWASHVYDENAVH